MPRLPPLRPIFDPDIRYGTQIAVPEATNTASIPAVATASTITRSVTTIAPSVTAPCIISFSDDFNRADGDPGSPWIQDNTGSPQIVSNQVTNGGLTGQQLFLNQPMCSPAFWAEIDVINLGSAFGNPEFWIAEDIKGAPNHGNLYCLGVGPNSNSGGNNDGWRIRNGTSGSLPLAFSSGNIPSTPFRMRCEVDISTGMLKIYGPVATLRLSVTDTTHTANVIGFRCSSGIVMDNFACGSL